MRPNSCPLSGGRRRRRKEEDEEEMSHFGRSGPPDIKDTYSLLVLNITFRTSADDLFPLFDRYGKVVDVFIPRDRRYKYADEAQRAVEKLDGRDVDGREMMVQFAKYGPNAERIQKGRIVEPVSKSRGRSGSLSPRRSSRHRDDYRDRDYRRRSRSRSRDRGYDRDRRRGRERDYRHRSRSYSRSPDPHRDYSRGRYAEEKRRSRSRSYESTSPPRRMPSPITSLSPRSGSASPVRRSRGRRSPSPRSASASPPRSPSPRSIADE